MNDGVLIDLLLFINNLNHSNIRTVCSMINKAIQNQGITERIIKNVIFYSMCINDNHEIMLDLIQALKNQYHFDTLNHKDIKLFQLKMKNDVKYARILSSLYKRKMIEIDFILKMIRKLSLQSLFLILRLVQSTEYQKYVLDEIEQQSFNSNLTNKTTRKIIYHLNNNPKDNQKDGYEVLDEELNSYKNGITISASIYNDNLELYTQLTAFPDYVHDKQICLSIFCPFDSKIKVRAIDYAAYCGSIKCFKFLQLNGSKITKETVNYGIQSGNFEIIRLLKQSGASFEGTLSTAAKFHKNQIYNWLIEQELKNPENEIENIPLALCNLFMEDIFIAYLYFIYASNESAKFYFKQFIRSGQIDHVVLILSMKHDVLDLNNVISLAIDSRNVELVKLIIPYCSSDINRIDEGGDFPIHHAVAQQIPEIVRILLRNPKISLNSVNKNTGMTALHLASIKKSSSIVRMLLSDQRVDRYITDKTNSRPFDLALKNGDPIIIMEFIQAGVDFLQDIDNVFQKIVSIEDCKLLDCFLAFKRDNYHLNNILHRKNYSFKPEMQKIIDKWCEKCI